MSSQLLEEESLLGSFCQPLTVTVTETVTLWWYPLQKRLHFGDTRNRNGYIVVIPVTETVTLCWYPLQKRLHCGDTRYRNDYIVVIPVTETVTLCWYPLQIIHLDSDHDSGGTILQFEYNFLKAIYRKIHAPLLSVRRVQTYSELDCPLFRRKQFRGNYDFTEFRIYRNWAEFNEIP